MQQAHLFHATYSPWSEKARWALDVTGLPHRRSVYTPFVSALGLRWRMGDLQKRVSIPTLLTADGPITDSLAIARYAATTRGDDALFPAGLEEEIEDWNFRSETALAAGRAMSTRRIANDQQARA